jgi:hypothetical protein
MKQGNLQITQLGMHCTLKALSKHQQDHLATAQQHLTLLKPQDITNHLGGRDPWKSDL